MPPRKKKKVGPPKGDVPLQTRLPIEAHRQVTALARSRGTSVYHVARDLIVAQLGARQGDPHASLLEARLEEIEQRLAAAEGYITASLRRAD